MNTCCGSRSFHVLAWGLWCTCWLSCAWGQPPSDEPARPKASVLWRAYLTPDIPPVPLSNSCRLHDLIRAGNLYLTTREALTLVLENNLDVEVARLEPFVSAWQLRRAEGGGPVPRVQSAASLVGSVANGQGISGTEFASGMASAVNGSVGRTSSVTASQAGQGTQALDPVFQESTVFSHTSVPQVNTTLSATPVLVSAMRAYSASLGQSFLTGGSITISYAEHFLNENAPTDILNPSVAPNVSVSFQQNLLRGFGIAVNSRTIEVSKIGLKLSDLAFKTQVINAVVRTLNVYYGLVAVLEDVKAKQATLELAQMLYEDSQQLARIGALPELGLTSAAAHVATSQAELIATQTALQRQEVQLKNLISRTGSADPVLREVRIVPLDRIGLPEKDDLPSMDTMIQQALENRSDLIANKLKEHAAEVDALGSKNGLLPSVQAFGGEADAGLAGVPRAVIVNNARVTAEPRFRGGIGDALGQVFGRDSPTDRVGVSLHAPLLNRQAQADFGTDQLSIRQIQLSNQKDINQMQVDLMSAIVTLQQARAQHEAAVKNLALQNELLVSELEKLYRRASTPFLVRQVQRDLAASRSAELAALVSWSSARIALDQILGITLEVNHVSLREAMSGDVRGH